ncbi:B-box zinc finger protein 32 [Rhodamnia argentea]|uniref:B-box zinc finger protein 32 n=1 Tax=Rhodamnia argentea TaxID=178133 RepID=A0A8B8QI54_9MYRT|nr:B-box zinc finger protein 32 [Rhodamnia argentea]
MRPTPCELCKEAASVYCPSDSAFLCSGCDARVHQANFLVARHVRLPLCSGCGSLSDHRFSGAGAGLGPRRSALCLSCSDHLSVDAGSLSPSSSSSACISSTESLAIAPKEDKCSTASRKLEKTSLSSSLTGASGEGSDSPARFDGATAFSSEVSSGKRNDRTNDRRARTARFRETTRVDPKAEGVFAIWCRKLELSGGEAVAIASRALRVSGATPTALAPRVAMAASFWVAMRSGKGRGMSTWQDLKRVEGASGVPAKLILAGAGKLVRGARVEKARREERLEEGWAECTA